MHTNIFLNIRNERNSLLTIKCSFAIALIMVLFTSTSVVSGQEFYKGVDLSYVNELEDCGAVYYEDKVAVDPYQLFAEKNANIVRLRLWHNPDWTAYSTFDDVSKSISRAKEAGLEVILDFHYSDTWTDPAAQNIPLAWENVEDLETLADSLYNYTYKTLQKLGEKDLMPEFVQLGNEINGNIMLKEGEELYPVNWNRNKILLDRAAEAVAAINAEFSVSIKTILHIAQPENAIHWFRDAAENGIDNYDIIGLSYYPGWSTLSMREAANHVKLLKEAHNKEVLIVETGYPWTLDSKDDANNVLGQENLLEEYGSTTHQDTQRDFLIDFTYLVKENGGLGVVYWEPAWVSSDCSTQWGDGSHYENATFFDFDNNLHQGSHFLDYDYTIEPEGLKEKQVKFLVQMDGADTANGVFVTGIFTGEPWQFKKMMHVQGRIFEHTASIPGRSKGAYIFYNSASWLDAYQENVPLSCALYWNDHRKYVVHDQPLSLEYKWSSCAAIDWSDGDDDEVVLSTPNVSTKDQNIYPNPFSNQITIPDLKFNEQISIHDSAGKQIKFSINRTGKEAILNLSFLTKGVYILKVYKKEANNIFKIIKQ